MCIQVRQTTMLDSKQKIFDCSEILLVDMDPKNSKPTLLVREESVQPRKSYYISDDSMRFGMKPCPRERT